MAEFRGWPSSNAYYEETRPEDPHVLVKKARTCVERYRLQSVSHFAHYIQVYAVEDTEEQAQEQDLRRDMRMKISFDTYTTSKILDCRPHFAKNSNKPSSGVQARNGKSWVSLNKALSTHFPADSDLVNECVLREYWSANGKSFPWHSLPAELKDEILQYCVYLPTETSSIYWNQIQDYRKLYRDTPGIYEIIDKLQDWRHLLSVSHQVRAMVLRLVLERSNRYPGGFTLLGQDLRKFKHAFYRLASFYQLRHINGIPTNAREEASARRYRNFPLQYPQLFRFANMAHGVRKLFLQFDWLESLHFFKVSVGTLQSYRHSKLVTCDVFQKLPNLDSLHIDLPRKWWVDRPMQMGPPLFHKLEPCPRTLQRLIYERAAEVLTVYKDARLTGFLDLKEKYRFLNCRESAVLQLKFSPSELEELYTESDGIDGVQLETDEEAESDQSTPSPLSTTSYTREPRGRRRFVRRGGDKEPTVSMPDEFFPPHCECDLPCRDVIFLPPGWDKEQEQEREAENSDQD